MSTDQPQWPTEDEALIQWRRKRDYYTDNNAGMVRCAIDMCRAAWLAANDDPSKSPVGEVRRDPLRTSTSSWVALRLGQNGAGLTAKPWVILSPSGYLDGLDDDEVKGWPVIGAVPGSPAAEAQQ